jgi:hypothetical protein
MPEWHTALTITPLSPNKPIPEKGDKIKRTFGSITLTPVVLVHPSRNPPSPPLLTVI